MYAPVRASIVHVKPTDAAETGSSVSPCSAKLLFDWQVLETPPPFCICKGDEATCLVKSCSTYQSDLRLGKGYRTLLSVIQPSLRILLQQRSSKHAQFDTSTSGLKAVMTVETVHCFWQLAEA